MIELLSLSDLHLGEEYAFLNYGKNWDWTDQTQILPLYNCAASLAGLTSGHRPEVKVDKLVLLGDIFELATARIETAAKSGRDFFSWLFQWMFPERIIFIPGNHDHVFWMWWCIPPVDGQPDWWTRKPEKVKDQLKTEYAALPSLVSDPRTPIGVENQRWREDLIKFFFGRLIDPDRFYVGYPAYKGPACAPIGFRQPLFSTLFTHGHLNDPTFVRPKESGVIAKGMHWLADHAPKQVDLTNLETIEKTSWEYTNYHWYPPKVDTPMKERLYLWSLLFESGNPCRHPLEIGSRYTKEPAADLKRIESSGNDFTNLLRAAMGDSWYVNPYIYVYGHTHHGGAMPVEPGFLLYNTGGWLKKGKDRPPHTHLFCITSSGVAEMVRADFG
ncbi:metallophosphoesterase [Thermodesulfobacteriota bacterium]